MDDGGGPTAPAADRAAEEPEPAREAAAAFAAVVVPAVERVRQAGAGLAAAQADAGLELERAQRVLAWTSAVASGSAGGGNGADGADEFGEFGEAGEVGAVLGRLPQYVAKVRALANHLRTLEGRVERAKARAARLHAPQG